MVMQVGVEWRAARLRLLVVSLLILVDAHVAIQVARLREAQLTQLTLVGLFAAVHAHMLGESGRIGEGFATVFAPNRENTNKIV